MFQIVNTILRGYMRLLSEQINNFIHPLFYSNIIDIFSPSGEPISLHLGCCGGFAVKYHSFTHNAYQLQQTRLVNNPG